MSKDPLATSIVRSENGAQILQIDARHKDSISISQLLHLVADINRLLESFGVLIAIAVEDKYHQEFKKEFRPYLMCLHACGHHEIHEVTEEQNVEIIVKSALQTPCQACSGRKPN
jgi:hypothetical protein